MMPPCRRLARAGGCNPRALRRGRERVGSGAPENRRHAAHRRRNWRAIAAAAAALAFLVGGVAGWMARGASAAAPSAVEILHHRRARSAQALYRRGPSPDRGRGGRRRICCRGCRGGSAPRCAHPTSARSNSSCWADACCPAYSGPAALFMYEAPTANGSRSTARRLDAPRTAFRYYERQFRSGALDRGRYGWVVSGPRTRYKLKVLASAAYDQLEKRPPPPSQGARGMVTHVAARIVSLARRATSSSAPRALHRCSRGGQSEWWRKIARATLARQALAFEAEGAAAVVPAGWPVPPRHRASARAPCRRAPLHRA